MNIDATITLDLTIAEAIILNEFIRRTEDTLLKSSAFPEEMRAIWNLQCLIEKELTEPLISDYNAALQEARIKLG